VCVDKFQPSIECNNAKFLTLLWPQGFFPEW
jgi:hypothetical protein